MPEMKVNPSDAAHQGRYANMAFPAYKHVEYPKKITAGTLPNGKPRRLTVKDRAEEFDVKLKYAEGTGDSSKLTQEEISSLQREQAHNDEKRQLYSKQMEHEAEINRLKGELAGFKNINPSGEPRVRVDAGDHDDGKKKLVVDGGTNKTEIPVAKLGTSGQGANNANVETKGTGPSPANVTTSKP